MCRLFRFILTACAAFALASCNKGGGGSSSASGKEGRETVTTLEKVKITRILPADILSVEAFVSPDGSRAAV
jgi:hypothetical protein